MSLKLLNIPVSICIYADQKKCIGQLQLFCWLKSNCNHRFCVTNQLLFKAITDLDITKQTFNARMNWLLTHKWVSFNSKKQSWHLNSFNIIHRKTNLEIRKGVLWDNADFRRFKPFVYATILGYYAKRKDYIDNQKIRLKHGRNQVRMNKARPLLSLVSRSFNLPLNYISKAINTPKSTIQKMKLLAAKHSFINITNAFTKTTISVEDLRKMRTIGGLNDENIKKLVIRKGVVYEQQPDKFFINIEFRSKRKLKHF